MTRIANLIRCLAADQTGAVLVETAVVAPALIVMCIGGFEVATMVSKQTRLQSTAELATEIVVVSNPDTEAERLAIQNELSQSLASTASIQVGYRYRCGVESAMTTTPPSGCSEEALSTYLHIQLTDDYVPVWAQWGFGSGFEYDVQRTVQVS